MNDPKETLEITERILEAQHTIIERADTKGQAVLTVLTLLNFIAVIFLIPQISKLNSAFSFKVHIFFLVVFVFYSLVFVYCVWAVLKVLQPRIMDRAAGARADFPPSVRFFKDILSVDYADYERRVKEMSYADLADDNLRQIVLLSRIAEKKFAELERTQVPMQVLFSITAILMISVMILKILL